MAKTATTEKKKRKNGRAAAAKPGAAPGGAPVSSKHNTTLAKKRVRAGLAIGVVAKAVQISPGYYSRIEAGTATPPPELRRRINAALAGAPA